MRNHLGVPLLLLLAAAPAAADTPAELTRLPEPAGLGSLVRPPDAAAPPLVVILPDALGEDGRAEHYVGSLAARGIATLVLGLGEAAEADGAATEPAAAPDAVAPVLAWAAAAGFDPAQLGLMGFGLGGRAALAAAEGRPVVALYPGCTGLALPGAGPALILQGAEADRGCAELPRREGLALRLLPGAGHGWDAPGVLWPSPGPLLPDPAGEGRLRARTDTAATLVAAEATAAWFEARLIGERRAAR